MEEHMSERDKGAVQRADSAGNRLDKGAVEVHVAADGANRRRRVLIGAS